MLTEDRVRAAIKAAALTRRRRHDREARERPCRICFAYYYKPPFPEASLTLSLAHASSPHRLDTSTLGRLSHTHFHYAYYTLKYSHVTNTQTHTFKIRRSSSR